MPPWWPSARERTSWPQILQDAERNALKQFYVCGPYAVENLPGTVHHVPNGPR